ncbi:MAG: ferrous iron transport protein B [Planctomycetes bacterium]|nr:ferrous iron transport protein B [Planctomycetota bacterium]
MSTINSQRTISIALIGNPNTGKSTLFNALCGTRQRVGNYPGVTVEMKSGRLQVGSQNFTLLDLPGTYSLAPRSPDEMITIDVLLGRRSDVPQPDVVLCIVDAANLQRNLYLVSQVLELGRPTVVVLNMMDMVATRQMTVDAARLAQQLGVPVVPLQANKRIGIDQLREAIVTAGEATPFLSESPFPLAFQQAVMELETELSAAGQPLPRYLVERLLLDTSGYLAESHLDGAADRIVPAIGALRQRLAGQECPVPAIEAISRYQWVGRVLDGVATHPATRPITLSDSADRFLTHRFAGSIAFLILMAAVFQTVFFIGKLSGGWNEAAVDGAGQLVRGLLNWIGLAGGAIESLAVSGIVGGVGNVLVFLPQILALFLFIAVLEDSGYMARAAYLMDKLMSRLGLSGKSFIPLLSSFACAIPGIMAARVIENRRDRLITILVAPLMSCSARLPVYFLLAAAILPNRSFLFGLLSLQMLFIMAMYLLGMVVAAGVALLLRRTLLKGATPPFVMELPAYKMPSLRIVLWRAGERGWDFVRRAGTLIFATSILVWAAGYYPRASDTTNHPLRAEIAALTKQIEPLQEQSAAGKLSDAQKAKLTALESKQGDLQNQVAGDQMRQSYLGRAGRFIEPVVRPLGWDWRIGSAAVASFPAREVLVSTLGVIYNLGEGQDEESLSLREQLQKAKWDGTEQPVYTVPVALSLMVFFALCAQCASTLVVIKRETQSWRWPLFTFVYMTGLAYVGALIVYQVGTRFMS